MKDDFTPTPEQFRGLAERIKYNRRDPPVLMATMVFNINTILAALQIAGRSKQAKIIPLKIVRRTDGDT
jgi:hypothetical protein